MLTRTIAATAAPPPAPIAYEITRERGPESDRYLVTLRFVGAADGRTTLTLPGQWASAEHAERGVDALTVVTPGAHLEDTGKPDIKRIAHRPGAALTVR